MTYKLKDIKGNLPSSIYVIYFYGIKFTKQDLISVENTLRRYKDKYSHIGYLMAVSNTDARYCTKRELSLKGHNGRNPTIVIGHKIKTHIHLVIIGDNNNSAYTASKKIVEALNKRFEGKCRFYNIGKNIHDKNFINYSLKQAYKIRKEGLFKEILEKKKVIKTEKF